MSTRDKIAIVFILILVVVCAVFVKVDADGQGITINGMHIGCEYELAKYAKENPDGFINQSVNGSLFAERSLNLHNVTSGCCAWQNKGSTIGVWTTAHCINHQQGDNSAGRPAMANIIDVTWDSTLKQYKAAIYCGDPNPTGFATAPTCRDNNLKYLSRGMYLAARNDDKSNGNTLSGKYGLALARVFYNMFRNNTDINQYFRSNSGLNARFQCCHRI